MYIHMCFHIGIYRCCAKCWRAFEGGSVYIFIHTYIYIYTCIYTRISSIYTRISINMYIYKCIFIYAYTGVAQNADGRFQGESTARTGCIRHACHYFAWSVRSAGHIYIHIVMHIHTRIHMHTYERVDSETWHTFHYSASRVISAGHIYIHIYIHIHTYTYACTYIWESRQREQENAHTRTLIWMRYALWGGFD